MELVGAAHRHIQTEVIEAVTEIAVVATSYIHSPMIVPH